MADNYLERKMEELRSRKPSTSTQGALPRTMKGTLSFSLPEKRVLVVGNRPSQQPAASDISHASYIATASGLLTDICADFSRIGCKVALFSDETIPLIQGIRHYHYLNTYGIPHQSPELSLGVSELREDSLAPAFANLLKAWRDIDVVIFVDNSLTDLLLPLWTAHKQAYPIPSDYGGRLITFADAPTPLSDTLGNAGVTTNSISLIATDLADATSNSSNVAAIAECIRRTLLYLALPSSKPINRTTLHLCPGV